MQCAGTMVRLLPVFLPRAIIHPSNQGFIPGCSLNCDLMDMGGNLC